MSKKPEPKTAPPPTLEGIAEVAAGAAKLVGELSQEFEEFKAGFPVAAGDDNEVRAKIESIESAIAKLTHEVEQLLKRVAKVEKRMGGA